MVDRENPDQSKLLTVPIRPHSPARLTIFTDRDQAQYRQLVEWVYYLSRGKHAAPDAAPSASDSPGSDLPEADPAESPSLAGRSSVLMERGPKDTAVKHAPGGADAKTNRDWSEIFPDQRGTFAKPGDVQSESDAVKPVGAVQPVGAGEPLPVNPAARPKRPSRAPIGPSATEQVRKKPPLPAALEGFVPKDAFDPELFNRRYLSK